MSPSEFGLGVLTCPDSKRYIFFVSFSSLGWSEPKEDYFGMWCFLTLFHEIPPISLTHTIWLFVYQMVMFSLNTK